MALDAEQIRKLREAADREGVDAAELIEQTAESMGDEAQRPVADRLLVGFLPYIKVREFREIWLGLTDRVEDDELTIADYNTRHGEISLRAEDGADGGGE